MMPESININSSNFVFCFHDKILTKSNLGRMEFIQLTGYSPSSKEVRKETQDRNGDRFHGRRLLTGLTSHDILSYFSDSMQAHLPEKSNGHIN